MTGNHRDQKAQTGRLDICAVKGNVNGNTKRIMLTKNVTCLQLHYSPVLNQMIIGECRFCILDKPLFLHYFLLIMHFTEFEQKDSPLSEFVDQWVGRKISNVIAQVKNFACFFTLKRGDSRGNTAQNTELTKSRERQLHNI